MLGEPLKRSCVSPMCCKRCVCKAKYVGFFFSRAGGCRRIQVHCDWTRCSLSCNRGGDCWLCVGKEEPGRSPEVKVMLWAEWACAQKLLKNWITWEHLLLLLPYFWISKSEFQMGVEEHFILLSMKCYQVLINVLHLCYSTKHFFCIRQCLFWC